MTRPTPTTGASRRPTCPCPKCGAALAPAVARVVRHMAVRRSPTLPGGLSIDAYDSLVSSALDAPPDVPAELVVWHARLEPTPVRVAVVEACRHVEHACAPDVHTCDQCGATLGEGVTARAD